MHRRQHAVSSRTVGAVAMHQCGLNKMALYSTREERERGETPKEGGEVLTASELSRGHAGNARAQEDGGR
jgi:hypothetical protein